MRNGPDLEDVPEEVRDGMTFHLATDHRRRPCSGPVRRDAAADDDALAAVA